ncbi:hypothetical protein MED222_06080 [Vibrio sp. MED222]|nr:hypothetical protein MED222_06080 [Vibrio sp. MED222]
MISIISTSRWLKPRYLASNADNLATRLT